jgi:hypothetical protein
LRNLGRTEAHADLLVARLMENTARLLPTEIMIAVIRVSWPGTIAGPFNHNQIMAAIHKLIVINPDRRIMSGIKV